MDNKLKEKSVKGIKWLSINTIYSSILTPVFYLILAFLLTPEGFAYLAVFTLIYRVGPIPAKFGMEEAFIQKVNIDKEEFSSIVWFTVVTSVIVIMVLIFISPLIESFYSLSGLSTYVKILSIAVFAEGVESIFKSSLRKNFHFLSWSILLMAKITVRVGITVIFLCLGYGVVSILVGFVLSSTFSLVAFVIASYYLTDTRLQLSYNYSTLKQHIQFGFPITLQRAFQLLIQRADEVIIGILLSSEVLGVYFFGKNLITQIKTAITQSFSMILLPIYSNLKKSLDTMSVYYEKIIIYTSMIGLPLLVGLSLTADLFVPYIFGETWENSIKVIQYLSVVMIVQIIIVNNATSLLYSLNSPYAVLKVEAATSLLYIFSLLLTTATGGNMDTILFLYSAYLLVNGALFHYVASKKLKISIFSILMKMKYNFISILVMVILIVLLKLSIARVWNDLLIMFMVVLIGGFTYCTIELLLNKKNVHNLFRLVFKKV